MPTAKEMNDRMHHRIEINRAPVLTLWAAVVAERLGFDWEEALTLGRAVAGLSAHSKGKALGVNGQTEGQINRLKALKLAMYGRAGPELLRARLLPL